jgi:hypothetical protein
MSLNPNAQSYVPQMDVNAPSFYPSSYSNAARNIQRTYRGNNARRNLTRKKQAATKIQSRLRGNRSRTGKSERWGLPFPKSRRDLPFDPRMRRRIFDESLTGRREGVPGVEDEIGQLKRDNNLYQRELNQTIADSQNPNSEYSIGKKAKQERLKRYSRSNAIRLKDRLDTIAEESGKESQQYADALQEAMGQDDLEDIYESLLEVNQNDPYFYYNPEFEEADPRLSQQLNKREELLSKLYIDRLVDDKKYNKNIENNKKKIDLLKKEKIDLDTLDIFKCKDIKAMAQADNRLFLDEDFFNKKIKPCRDELTSIYIDTFYQLPWNIIMPDVQGSGRLNIGGISQSTNDFLSCTIESALEPMERRYSRAVVNALKDTLMTMGLIMTHEQISRSHNIELNGTYYGLPTNNFVILTNFYRFAVEDRRTVLGHLPRHPRFDGTRRYPGHPYIVGRLGDEIRGAVSINGEDALEYTLNLFHDTVLDRGLKLNGQLIESDDIERMKRYFILRLIGLIDNDSYIFRLKERIVRLENSLSNMVYEEHGDMYDEKKDEIKKLKLIEQNILAYPNN